MYSYSEFDEGFVRERVAQFSAQVDRRIEGALTEDEFRPLRLMNGLYLQLHAYMLRVAIPYGTLNPHQMRQLAGPLMAMLGKASGAMVASQVGSGLGALAGDVLSASDIGLPLGPIGKAALLPTNVAAFAAECAFDLGGRRLKLDSLWVNVLKPGGTHSGHIHPHSVVSGTVYVAVPPGSGALKLEDPRLPMMMAAPTSIG